MHSNVTIKNVSWPHFSWPTLYNVQVRADHLSGKPGNVRHFIKSHGSVMGKILSEKNGQELFIVNYIFAFVRVFSS